MLADGIGLTRVYAFTKYAGINVQWLCDNNFLNKQSCNWHDGINTELISWQLTKYKDIFMPFSFYQCNMTGWGLNTNGFGISANQLESAQKSFAEAWERLWYLKLVNQSMSGLSITSSNGFAAGSSSEMATSNAKNELIERVVMINAWSGQSGWSLANPTLLANKIILMALNLKGWDVKIFNIRSNLGTIKACLAQNVSQGAIFDTTLSLNDSTAEIKVINSVLKNTFFHKTVSSYNLPEQGGPQDHRLFYSDAKNLKAFKFLAKVRNNNSDLVVVHNFDKIQMHLIQKAGLFPAVAVAINNYWPELKWGTQSVSGINKWPHPLA